MKRFKKPAIYLRNKRFVTAVRQTVAVVRANDGLVYLQDKEDEKLYPVPPGIQIPYEYYNSELTILIRLVSQEVIVNMGAEDMLSSEINDEDESILVVENCYELEQILAELKADRFAEMTKPFSTLIAGCLLFGAGLNLYLTGFVFPIVALIAAIFGIAAAIIGGFMPVVSFALAFASARFYDMRGRYIDLSNGRSNLNGGMVIPTKKVVSAWGN